MIDRLLKSQLEPLARKSRRWELWRALALCWLALAAAGLMVFLLEKLAGWSSPLIFLLLAVAALAAGVTVLRRFGARPVDCQGLARQIERENPELHALLLTAVEQQPSSPTGELNYLQQRVVLEALEKYRRSEWGERIARRHAVALAAQWAALALLATVLVAMCPRISLLHPGQLWSALNADNGVSVTPGDASLERGSALVVLVKFGGKLPAEAQLVVNPVNENEQTIPLSKNLEDPVFGGGVPQVKGDLKYHVQYTSGRTRDYQVTVFDYPKLDRADATIDYPTYTGLAEKTIKDTRRVSAVEGSSLAYSFYLNKPVVSARWVAKDGPAVPLTADATNATIYHTQLKLDQSQRYTLMLVDDAGRTNKLPPEFVLDALKDRPADVKIDSPRGDQRVSPLAEINFSAEATGEFGLHSYGIAYSLGDGATNTVELGQGGKAGEKKQFSYLLPLESLGAEPDQLLSYYVWADDTGPDGKPRRNTSDIFFAEIKPFEEIFRQAEPGEGQGNPPPERLADVEKDIASAIWNLQRRETDKKPSPNYKDDVGVARDSQQHALDLLNGMRAQNPDPTLAPLFDPAEKEIRKAEEQLGQAADKNSLAPLPDALNTTQAAYQAALRLEAREYQVTRGGRGRGGSPRSRAQREADQLDLQQQAERYQSERTASAQRQQTAQQREQAQIASRLKDLARRQQDLNDRLRELQAALQEAKTPQERAELQDQLKRLTDEQRDMLADVDELRQRMDNTENQSQMTQQRQELEQTRSELQKAAEQLGQNSLSQAVASGTRAQDQLKQLQDQVRKMNSGQFTEAMRQMRNDARQLAQNEQDLAKKISDLADNQQLGETDEQKQQRMDLAQQFLRQKDAVTNLVDQMRQVSEQSETAEPLLSSQLYDTLRQTGLDQLDNSLMTTSEYVQRGFLPQARPAEQPARQNIDQLKEGVDRAAESILGDDTEALRLAQQELRQLSDALNGAGNNNDRTNGPANSGGGQPDQPGSNQNPGVGQGQGEPSQQQANSGDGQGNGQPNGQPGPGNGRGGSGQNPDGKPGNQPPGNGNNQANADQPGQGQGQGQGQSLASDERGANNGAHGVGGLNMGNGLYDGPLTDDNYVQWTEGLRNVEDMVDLPDITSEVTQIRDRARILRLDFKRTGQRPDWAVITTQISTPLAEVRERVNEELLKRQSKDALVPLDRDPVPPKYSDQVKRYYEQLGKSD
jgi:hypothetical protein